MPTPEIKLYQRYTKKYEVILIYKTKCASTKFLKHVPPHVSTPNLCQEMVYFCSYSKVKEFLMMLLDT